MIPRTLLVAAFSLAVGASQAIADQLSLREISSYLNGLKQAQGAFTQINDDGTISTGTIFLHRPGRMRFEYNPPDEALVLAGSGSVAVFDTKLRTVERYPLDRTPLSIILAKKVDLDRANMVTGHSYDGTATTVTAQDPEHPEYGNIQLKFTGDPVELRQWQINDDSGSSTTVVLGELDKKVRLPGSLFNITRAVEELTDN
jgi:outer membrane lipoprotein-sorting protein